MGICVRTCFCPLMLFQLQLGFRVRFPHSLTLPWEFSVVAAGSWEEEGRWGLKESSS